LTENYPYNVQFLSHQLWDMNFEKKYMEKTDVDEALKRILLEQNPYYLSMWDSLTLHQRSVLKSIAYFGGKRYFHKNLFKLVILGQLPLYRLL